MVLSARCSSMLARALARVWHFVVGTFALSVLLTLVPSTFASQRVTLDLGSAGQPVLLEDWGDMWLEHSGRLLVDEVADGSDIPWIPTRAGIDAVLGPEDTLWIRFVVPPAPDAEQWYVRIEQPTLNLVTLYSQDSTGKWTGSSAGDRRPVSSWPVPNRYPLLPIRVSAEEPRHYLLSIRNVGALYAPISFVSESYVYRHEQQVSLILGTYFGLAALAVVFSLLTGFSRREAAYVCVALSISLIGVTEAATSGAGGLHLWSSSPWWTDHASSILGILATGTTVWCALATVSLDERSTAIHFFGLSAAAFALPAAAAICVIPPTTHSAIVVTYSTSAAIIGVSCVLWAAFRGDRQAGWLLASAVPLLVAALFRASVEWRLVHPSFWTEHGIKLGTAVHWPLLLLGLTLRDQDRLENARRVHGLASFDPTTGLINRDEFVSRALSALQRAARANTNCALLVIRISNVTALSQEFGSKSVVDLPLLIASRLLAASRHIDTIGRIGRGRFGILLEQVDQRDFAAIGARFVARCLVPYPRKPSGWVPQVQVAQTLVARANQSASDIIAQLEATLRQVPPWSKRSVFSVQSGSTSNGS